MLTQEQINEAVKDTLPDILAGLRREIAETAVHQAKQAAYAAIGTAVTEWIKAELIPEVIESLAESKSGFAGFGPKLAGGLVDALADSLMEQTKKKLESSYERKKIFEALIG